MAPGGRALVIQVVRRDDQARTEEPPWTLTRAEMEAVAGEDVLLDTIEEVLPPGRVNPLWRMLLTKERPPASR
jgi:hypothetical protein